MFGGKFLFLGKKEIWNPAIRGLVRMRFLATNDGNICSPENYASASFNTCAGFMKSRPFQEMMNQLKK